MSNPIPPELVNEAPYCYPRLNRVWAGLLMGLLDPLRYDWYWEGTDQEKIDVRNQVDELIILLMQTEVTDLTIGTIFPIYGHLPANSLLLNNAQYNKSDYPLLYDVLPPELKITGTTFRVPPSPAWVASPSIASHTASSNTSGNTADKVSDALGTTYWESSGNTPQWVQINFDRFSHVVSYQVQSATIGEYPVDWTLEASVAGTWIIVDTRVGQSFSGQETKVYGLVQGANGVAFRMNVSASNGGGKVAIAALILAARQAHHYAIKAKYEQ